MPDEYVSAEEAAEFLDVKRQTLYAYVSRGWLESVPDPKSHRSRLYKRTDLERLKARSEARAGDGPVAAAALRWGAPVLETEICEIRPDGPVYRGHSLVQLIRDGTSFGDVRGILTGLDVPTAAFDPGAPAAGRPEPVDLLRHALLAAELTDSSRVVPTEQAVGKHVGRIYAAMLAGLQRAFAAEMRDGNVAQMVTHALGGDSSNAATVRAVETALIVSAEHELNVSAFAARVAASSGANLYACVTAALAAFTGPRHGGMGIRVRRLLAELAERPATDVLTDRLRAGEDVPGLGHPLYEHGDPRFQMLWEAAVAVDEESLKPVAELASATGELGLEPPNLDVGLVAVSMACQLVPGSESALFAIGRTAGWVAHAREQAAQNFLLRPRAVYVGT